MIDIEASQVRRAPGRMPATSKEALGAIGLNLFIERGFDRVTVEDIASAAGIGRRTFFRYFPSKNDVAWGDFEALLEGFAVTLRESPESVRTVDAIRRAVREFNRVPEAELERHRHRMRMLLTTPELVAHATVRYTAWREVIAEFVADREGQRPSDPLPQAVSWACLGLSLSAYEQWIDAGADLGDLIDGAFAALQEVFSGSVGEQAGR